MNFKKISNKNITLKDFTVKINELSNVEVFNSTDNQQWLWLYYKLLVDFLFKNKEVVSEQELSEFIELDIANIANTYKEDLTENRMHLLVKLQNYNQINSFDETVLKNLFITKLASPYSESAMTSTTFPSALPPAIDILYPPVTPKPLGDPCIFVFLIST